MLLVWRESYDVNGQLRRLSAGKQARLSRALMDVRVWFVGKILDKLAADDRALRDDRERSGSPV